jgi:Kyakuja-Dileera-Zisupton transposase
LATEEQLAISVDAIVCVDACFTQKRRKSQGKAWAPPREHCETIFIDPEEVATMEEFVETVRPSRPPRGKSGRGESSTHQAAENSVRPEVDTDFEPGLRVPESVLNECKESFVAADSNRVKASTLFFSDTGLMALLCRHDRVLWLVNMTSAGEKQHYVLCLLQKLFQHLPPKMRIGLLYDIGCQLHRSCLVYRCFMHMAINGLVKLSTILGNAKDLD